MITISGENVFKLNSVPHDWKTCLLDEAVKIQGGSQPPKKVFRSELEEGYVRLVQIRDYKSDRYLTYVPKNSTKKFCTKDDIMIGRYGPPVFQILRGIEGAYNVALMKAIPLFNMDRNFLFHLLSSPPVQNLVIKNSQRTAGQTGVNLKLLNSCIIPLPPLDQQKKIAAILDAADAYRQKTKALIEKYDELTQSLFLDMFGDPVTNPRGWDKVLFSEIATFHNGDRGKNYPSQSAFVEMGIPFINAGNLSNYAIDNQGLNFISNERFDLLSSGKIKREDILFCLRGSLGKFAVNRTHDIGAIASSLVLIRINNHVTLDYITGLLKTNYIAGLIKKSDNGSSQPNLSAKSVKQFIVPLPSLELQNQFSKRVQAIEEQKAQAEASLAQAEDLFNSLLQRAFKGELTS